MQAQGVETVTISGCKKLFGTTDLCAYKRLVMNQGSHIFLNLLLTEHCNSLGSHLSQPPSHECKFIDKVLCMAPGNLERYKNLHLGENNSTNLKAFFNLKICYRLTY